MMGAVPPEKANVKERIEIIFAERIPFYPYRTASVEILHQSELKKL